MKNFGFILICFILFSAASCQKDFSVPENSKNTEGVLISDEDEKDSVIEYYDDERDTISDLDLPNYNSELTTTSITSIVDSKVIGNQGIELGCPTYKYYLRYIADKKEPTWFTMTLSRPDSVSLAYQDIDSSAVLFDSLYQITPTEIKVRCRALQDTMQTKTWAIGLKSKYTYKLTDTRGGTTNINFIIRRKMKFVGRLNGHLYGTNGWMVEYWRHYFGNQNKTNAPISTLIDQSYEAKAGDILVWGVTAGANEGTVMPYPTPKSYIVAASKTLPSYRVNRFWVSEMNTRCKGEKTVKAIWMKSYKPATTLYSANKTRGAAVRYYRFN